MILRGKFILGGNYTIEVLEVLLHEASEITIYVFLGITVVEQPRVHEMLSERLGTDTLHRYRHMHLAIVVCND